MEQKTPVLEMDHISKSFPGVKALDGVSLTVCPGTVHALMGENGAGKSTLMKCAFGLYHPDEGAIKISGEQVHFVDARDAMDKGISMIHQELHPIRTRNIMENIWVGRVPYKKLGPVKWVDEKKMYEDTQALFKDLEVNLDPRTMVQEHSASNCQLIEIARAVSYGAKVIIMDEPTSSLTSASARSFKDVSFSVRRGEIFGIGGLVAAQKPELMAFIFGLPPIASGEVLFKRRNASICSAQGAIQLVMALLSEERRPSCIIPMLSITDNTVLANQTAHTRQYTGGSPFLNNKLREEHAQKYVDALSTKTPTLKTQIQYLSGGNQQKVLLGRWLLVNPDLLILDEPTRGIDVGAKYEIYLLMEKMVKEGKTVIMISSEMPELMGMSDRIMVMCEGRLSGILDGAGATDEKIMMLASTYEAAAV